jgi:cytosine/adenosine deaminase-related metal-dependent hydrolase
VIRRPDLVLALSALAFAAQPACAPAVRPPAATTTPEVVRVAPPTGDQATDRASILALEYTRMGVMLGSAPDTIRYVDIIDGHIVGERLVWREGPDSWGYSYTGGRWPWTRAERLVLDDEGLPVRLEVSGVMDIGVAWRERFERQDGIARWFTPLERGEAPAEPAYYPAIHPAHDLGVLARALLRRSAGKLPLLPAGEAHLRPLGERTVRANGQSRSVRLYAIHGLDLAPAYVWLDGEGATFAEEWSIVAGWEAVLPELRTATAAAAAEHRLELAGTLVPAARTRPLVIRGARLFDAVSGTVREGTTIVVHGNRIAAVGEDGRVAIPAGAEMVEAEGRMALPGLWDMHAHFSIPTLDRESHALLDLAAGVTTARDLAANVEAIVALRAAIDAGHAVGPRIVLAGYIDGVAGEKRGLGILVDSPEAARAAVDRYAELGFVQVKTYNHLPAELVPVVVARARERGLRVSGHIPFALMSGEAVAAGYDELHHLHMILGDITVRPIEAAAQGETWHTWYQVMAGMTPESPAVVEFIELLVARGVVVDPTLGLFASAGVPPEFIADAVDRLPAQVRRRVKHLTAAYDMVPVHPLARPAWERTVANLSALLLALHRAGVPIVVGTDTWSGFGLQHEMALYVAAGIPAPDVLTLATLGAARVMRMDGELGSIEPGKLADLILVDGDPTTDIRDIRRVMMVVKDGRVYDPAAMYRALDIQPCCAQ